MKDECSENVRVCSDAKCREPKCESVKTQITPLPFTPKFSLHISQGQNLKSCSNNLFLIQTPTQFRLHNQTRLITPRENSNSCFYNKYPFSPYLQFSPYTRTHLLKVSFKANILQSSTPTHTFSQWHDNKIIYFHYSQISTYV